MDENFDSALVELLGGGSDKGKCIYVCVCVCVCVYRVGGEGGGGGMYMEDNNMPIHNN